MHTAAIIAPVSYNYTTYLLCILGIIEMDPKYCLFKVKFIQQKFPSAPLQPTVLLLGGRGGGRGIPNVRGNKVGICSGRKESVRIPHFPKRGASGLGAVMLAEKYLCDL